MIPLVTVCCSTYNHVEFIKQALDGFVMQQTTFPFEIIISDDASSDGTSDILREYANKYDNIHLILNEKNQWKEGMVNGTFFGFEPLVYNILPRAQGKYLAFCEGDDYWTDPLKLQKQFEYLEDHPKDVMCWHAYSILRNGVISGGFTDGMGKSYNSKELITVPNGIASATKMFRNLYNDTTKEAYQAFRGDYLFTSYMGLFGGCGFIKGIAPSIYRIHSNGVWMGLNRNIQKIRYQEMLENLYDLHSKYGTPTSIAIRNALRYNRDTFAIILPTYRRKDGNTPKLLKITLDSIFAQTYKDFKIYLIGDYYENDKEILDLISNYPPKKIFYENLSFAKERSKYREGSRELWCSGGVNASNYAMAKATADRLQYACFIDHDDTWLPNHLQTLHKAIEQTNARWLCTKTNVNVLYFFPNVETKESMVELLPIPEGVIKSSTCFDLQVIPFRFRDVLAETGTIYPADADLWSRMRDFMITFNLKGYYLNTLTCNYISGGIKRPAQAIIPWRKGDNKVNPLPRKRMTWRDKIATCQVRSNILQTGAHI